MKFTIHNVCEIWSEKLSDSFLVDKFSSVWIQDGENGLLRVLVHSCDGMVYDLYDTYDLNDAIAARQRVEIAIQGLV